jgi:hypothetical protein
MPPVGFEPTTPVLERAKTVHALDWAATVIGYNYIYIYIYIYTVAKTVSRSTYFCITNVRPLNYLTLNRVNDDLLLVSTVRYLLTVNCKKKHNLQTERRGGMVSSSASYREVPGTNVCQENCYLKWGVSRRFSIPPAIWRNTILKYLRGGGRGFRLEDVQRGTLREPYYRRDTLAVTRI